MVTTVCKLWSSQISSPLFTSTSNLHLIKFSQIRFVLICVDLWTVGNVAIHLRQGYGGQDVKVLPVPVFNTNEAWVRVMGWSGEWWTRNQQRGTKNSLLELWLNLFREARESGRFSVAALDGVSCRVKWRSTIGLMERDWPYGHAIWSFAICIVRRSFLAAMQNLQTPNQEPISRC